MDEWKERFRADVAKELLLAVAPPVMDRLWRTGRAAPDGELAEVCANIADALCYALGFDDEDNDEPPQLRDRVLSALESCMKKDGSQKYVLPAVIAEMVGESKGAVRGALCGLRNEGLVWHSGNGSFCFKREG